MKFYETIGFKMFITLFLVSSVTLGVGGFYFNQMYVESTTNQIFESLSHTITLQSERVTDYGHDSLDLLSQFSIRPTLLGYIANYMSGDLTNFKEIKQSFQALGLEENVENIVFLDVKGNIVLSVSDCILPNSTIQMLFNFGKIHDKLILEDFGGTPRIYVTGPIFFEEKILGVLVYEFNIKGLQEIAAGYTGDHVSEEFIMAYKNIRNETIFFTELKFDVPNNTAELSETLPMKTALNGEITSLSNSVDYRGESVFASTGYVEAGKIGLVVKIDQAEALLPAYSFRNSVVTGTFLFQIILTCFSYVFSKGITQPIVKLSKDMTKFGSNLDDISIQTVRGDELDALQTTFNSMAQRIAFNTDELNRKNRELANLNEEIKAFSYSVSHDLRAPLRAIDGFSLNILEDNGGQLDEQGRIYLNRVRSAAQKMSRLIDDMLSLSKITQRELVVGEVNLSKLSFDILNELMVQDSSRKVISKILPDIIVRGDESLLRILLFNLFSNSWKYTSKRKEALIELGSEMIEGERVIFVRDNGVGFDMKYYNKLFQAFQRLHSEVDFHGDGIGLSLSRRIISRHSGRIWGNGVVNGGATFYFTLKL